MPKRNPKGTSGKNLVIAMFVFYADAKGIMVHKHLAMLLITKDLYILIKLLLFNSYHISNLSNACLNASLS